jgi:hypothetical protein
MCKCDKQMAHTSLWPAALRTSPASVDVFACDGTAVRRTQSRGLVCWAPRTAAAPGPVVRSCLGHSSCI